MSLPNKKDLANSYRENLIRDNRKHLLDYFTKKVNAENPRYTLTAFREWLNLQTVMDLEQILQ